MMFRVMNKIKDSRINKDKRKKERGDTDGLSGRPDC